LRDQMLITNVVVRLRRQLAEPLPHIDRQLAPGWSSHILMISDPATGIVWAPTRHGRSTPGLARNPLTASWSGAPVRPSGHSPLAATPATPPRPAATSGNSRNHRLATWTKAFAPTALTHYAACGTIP
jgi:hypothetical protein